MSSNKENINKPLKGMNRDFAKYNLDSNSYTFAYNSNVESFNGEGPIQHTNEPSNLLCTNFKQGYQVLGHYNDYNDDKTYFFLKNPTTGLSEIGYISNISNFVDTEDVESECNCNITVILDAPLEDTVQTPFCSYTTLLTDCDENQCLNFSINNPINYVEKISEDGDDYLYFTDNTNPVRKINIEDTSIYGYVGTISDCDEEEPTCLDCSKMRVFPEFEKPCLNPETIVYGGNLSAGSYEFMVAYSDDDGNELSNYFSLTNPVYIYDLNDNILTQPELDYQTNLAIKLTVDCLDSNYAYYKVVSLEKDALNEESVFREVGVFNINDNVVTYSSQKDKQLITLNEIFSKKVIYEKAKGLTTVDSRLLQFGLTSHIEVNLQPVVNLMGAFAKWSTVVAREDIYEDPILTSETKGYMRDEVYPFSIKFITNNGYETSLFPFIARPAINDEEDLVTPNPDIESINDYSPNCSEIERTKKWQYYNTATVDSELCLASSGEEEVIIQEQRTCTVLDGEDIKIVDSIANGELIINGDVEIEDLEQYVNGGGQFDGGSSLATLESILANSYSSETCNPFSDSDCDNITEIDRDIKVLQVDSEFVTKVEKDFPNDYTRTIEPDECGRFQLIKDENNNFILDQDFIDDFMLSNETVYPVSGSINNFSCNNASLLDTVVNPLTYSGSSYFFKNEGSLTLSGLLDSSRTISDSASITSEFLSNLHKGASWFKFDFQGKSEMIFEVSEMSGCEITDDVTTGNLLRFSTYNECTSSNSIDSGIFSSSTGTIIKLQRVNYTSDTIFIAIDTQLRVRTITTNNSGGSSIDVYTLRPPCGCYHIVQRPVEVERTEFTFSNIDFFKIGTYQADCTYFIPQLNECSTAPYKKGNFSYWESESKYPCNEDLYNSQLLTRIDSSKIPESIKTDFEGYYVDSTNADGTYTLSNAANFMNKNIRHYKFPCNSISPFMDSNYKATQGTTLVYPIGFSISEEVIAFFLDTAVDNNLISSELRSKITHYEIYRGDRRIDKSIVAKGLMYDMYLYKDINNTDKWYPNFPYNNLGKDLLHNINHPFGSTHNINYTFHSPDTHIRKVDIGSELKVEGYQYGYSTGKFVDVRNHPEWVILGQPAYTLAGVLAGLEVAYEAAVYAGAVGVNGTTGGISAPAGIAAAIIAVAAQVFAGLYRAGQYRYQWLETFRNIGTTNNFAYYYTSYGDYNYFKPNNTIGQLLRGIGTGKYIKPGDLKVNQEFNNSVIDINNLDRERSVYIGLGEHELYYPSSYVNHDNTISNPFWASRTVDSIWGHCGEGVGEDLIKNIASPMISIKNYVPNQYGNLNSIKWFSTGKCGKLEDLEGNCNTFFGGDIYISRFSLKRKIPLFSEDAMRQADLTPFAYSRYKNIPSLQYYVDYEVNVDGPSFAGSIFPDKRTEIDNMDCQDNTFYVKPPTKFYLYYYGIPNFLVESEINCNLRYGKREPHENFYPNTTDYVNFTQETVVPIREPNTFFYNNVYSDSKTLSRDQLLNLDFRNKDAEDNIFENNSVIYSDKNNWSVYKPLNYFKFSSKYGNLVSLDSIESSQLLGRFENQTILYNKLNAYSDAQTVNNNLLGDGSLFSQRPFEFNKTDHGYMGSQHRTKVSCEFGHFWVDAKRGQVFHLQPNAQGVKNITGDLKHWFREHLPFKILKGGITNLKATDLDNTCKGLGITLGWDNRYKRVFLTKLDYKVKDEYKNNLRFEDGKILYQTQEVQFTDTTYFEACHFTIAYKPELEQWISYYGFYPNYYLSYDNYFKTGYNNGESSLWSHLLTNRSYQVFNGVKQPWIVEYPLMNNMVNSMLHNIEYWLDTKVYRTRYDYSEFRGLGFNKAVIYNKSNNSGDLNLIPAQKNNLNQQMNYPIFNSNSIDILASEDDKKWSFNYFYNNVIDETNLQPIWLNDCNEIFKNLNPNSVSYVNRWKDRMRGDYFLVRLTQDKETRYNMTLKWLGDKRTYYEQ